MRMSPDPRARWICAAAGLALVAGLLHEPAAATPVEQPIVRSDTPLERSDEAAAVATDRTTGRPVLITSKTTDSTEYRALPSGQIEATISGGPVRMRDADGAWTA